MSKDSDVYELRRELRFSWSYVSDELGKEIGEWLIESYQRNDADTAREYVEHHLNRFLRRYPMYNSVDVAKGDDAFPEKCTDCKHYGAACPVLTDGIQDRWRERELSGAENEQEARRVYEQQARDTGCVVIPDLLETWDESISGFMQKGQELLLRTKEEMRQNPDVDDIEDVEGDVDELLEDADLDLDLDLESVEEAVATGPGGDA